jgi:hypothetical protein
MKNLNDNAIRFEIEWRDLLITKLESAGRALAKARNAEEAAIAARIADLSVYETEYEIMEAYGWEHITESERDRLLDVLRKKDEDIETLHSTVSGAALEELRAFTARLKSDVRSLNWELLPDEEKQRIKQSSAKYKAEMTARRKARNAPDGQVRQ